MKPFQTEVWPKKTAPWRCFLIVTGLRPSGGLWGRRAGTHPELPALLPHQPAVLDEVHGALVHGAVGFVAQPVLVALRWGRNAVSPSWTWRGRPWPRSSACGHERGEPRPWAPATAVHEATSRFVLPSLAPSPHPGNSWHVLHRDTRPEPTPSCSRPGCPVPRPPARKDRTNPTPPHPTQLQRLPAGTRAGAWPPSGQWGCAWGPWGAEGRSSPLGLRSAEEGVRAAGRWAGERAAPRGCAHPGERCKGHAEAPDVGCSAPRGGRELGGWPGGGLRGRGFACRGGRGLRRKWGAGRAGG